MPPLPTCPRTQSFSVDIRRSYSTGRQEFSRAFAGKELELTISTSGQFPQNAQATLVTTINASRPGEWLEVPFVRTDIKTFTCKIVPERTGLYSFWTRFSIDGGKTWAHDPVPDAWVVVDPPQVDEMRLYTLIPSVSGSIPDWSKALKNIKDMGFNTIHLLPLTTLDTSQSPYSAKDLFSVDPSYLAQDGRDGLTQL